MELLETVRRSEGDQLNPLCRTTLLEPDGPTDRCLVLFHGITNCPQQFVQLSQEFQRLGYRVLIPRAPHHGMADRLTTEQQKLRAGELLKFAEDSADIAGGLARRVTVAGLSMGGVLAGWLGQRRADVERAVMISPLFALRGLPPWVHPPAAKVISKLPNAYMWWDSRLKAAIKPAHAYPRISSRAYAALLGAGAAVRAAARRQAPMAGSIGVVTNAHDPGVNNSATALIVADWRRHGADVETFEFPNEERLPHDLIDPAQDDQRTDFVYPVLIRMITGKRG